MIKLLLKLLPALTPVIFYFIWIYVIEKLIIKKLIKKNNIIETEKEVGSKSTEEKFKTKKVGNFSLNNQNFVKILYLTLIIAIFNFIFLAIS